MCGLVGAFRSKDAFWDTNIEKFMFQGMFLSVLRGIHGTGIGLIYKDTKVAPKVIKTQTDAYNFINSENYQWAESEFKYCSAMLGHTRSPTIANSISAKNAQPFQYRRHNDDDEWYVLTHNGHITNHLSLTPSSFSHQVDSAHVCYAFAGEGADRVLPDISGSYVLIWYRKKDNTINIAKNDARSLFMAFGKDYKNVFYSSEEPFLSMLLDRNAIAIEGKIKEVPSHLWLSWKLDSPTLEKFTEKTYERKKETKVTKHLPGPVNTSPSSSARFPQKGDWIWVNVFDNSLIVPYTRTDGSDTGFGFVYGTRNMNAGSVVKIESIRRAEWDAKFNRVRNALPCIVKYACEEKDSQNRPYMYYEVFLKKEACDKEYLERKDKNNLEEPQNGCEPEVTVEEKHTVACAVVEKPLPEVPDDTDEMVPGPNAGQFITQKEWDALADMGCYFCERKILDIEMADIDWAPWNRGPEDSEEEDEYQMICPDCAKNPGLMQSLAL